MIQVNERQDALVCMEVWGDNRRVIRTIELAGLTIWVHSNSAGPDNGGGGGDVYDISVFGEFCKDNLVDNNETIFAIQRGNCS
jgi:hypothetical protein